MSRSPFKALTAPGRSAWGNGSTTRAGIRRRKTVADSEPNETYRACSLGRRAGAMAYDALILVALWMIAAAVVVIAIDDPVDSGNPLFQLYLLLLALAYFHVSWSRIGQTLGMRAWRIRLDPGPEPFTIARSVKRFFAGLVSFLALGLGFAWSLMRSDRRAWPDLASRSQLIYRRPPGRRTRSSAQQHQPQKPE